MYPSTLISLIVLLTSSIAALASAAAVSSESKPLPLIIWHGLGDNYAADGLAAVAELANETNPGTFVYQIRLSDDPGSDRTATFFGNTTDQIAQVCAELAAHPVLSLAPAVNALGFSQGGQFLRGFVERCNVPPVRNLVTFGSQHNGIAEFQACGPTDWLCKGAMALLRTNTWSDYVQSHLVPAQYYRSCNVSTGKPTEEYLEHSNFLADINNERSRKNATYAKNLASLNKFVMYLFTDDKTVIPKESGWFAQVTNGVVEPLHNRTIYKEDWIGLKQLDKKGALVFNETEGEHMQLTEEVLIQVFKTYYGEKWKDLTVQKEEGQLEL